MLLSLRATTTEDPKMRSLCTTTREEPRPAATTEKGHSNEDPVQPQIKLISLTLISFHFLYFLLLQIHSETAYILQVLKILGNGNSGPNKGLIKDLMLLSSMKAVWEI